jgi:SNF2 family DNA or RNA helicase
MRLVQVASNPRLVDDSYRAVPGKFPLLLNLVHQAVDAGEKMIVWTSFTDNVDWIARELSDFGAVRVHGKLSFLQRDTSIKNFKLDKSCKILVATPAAAKEGLTLTVANHAVFYDRSFSLDDYLQAQDRIHRISQSRPCYISNLIANDSIDGWVDVLLAAKHLAAQLGQGGHQP